MAEMIYYMLEAGAEKIAVLIEFLLISFWKEIKKLE